jgi:hypothetical protein
LRGPAEYILTPSDAPAMQGLEEPSRKALDGLDPMQDEEWRTC